MPIGSSPYYIMPLGIFPTQGGVPVPITQTEFEDCCCCPVYPIYFFITGGYIMRMYISPFGDCTQTCCWISVEVQALDYNGVRVFDVRTCSSIITGGDTECECPNSGGCPDCACPNGRLFNATYVTPSNGVGWAGAWCAPTDGAGIEWDQGTYPYPFSTPPNAYAHKFDNAGSADWTLTLTASPTCDSDDPVSCGGSQSMSLTFHNSKGTDSAPDYYIQCCAAYTGGVDPWCPPNAIGTCWDDAP